MKPRLQGTFELARMTDDEFRLTIEDKASGLVVMQAFITPANLALAISCRSGLPLEFEPTVPFVQGKIGQICTTKVVVLEGPDAHAAKTMAPDRHRDKGERYAVVESTFNAWLLQRGIAVMQAELGEDYRPGWLLFTNGATSQQQPRQWKFCMNRYDYPPDGPEVEP